jgi:hypothetical protein
VPLHKRILVQNILTIGWAAYLSHCDEQFEKDKESRNQKVKTTLVAA